MPVSILNQLNKITIITVLQLVLTLRFIKQV